MTKLRTLAMIAFLPFAAASCSNITHPDDIVTLRHPDDIVTLRGNVYQEPFYGPPNYGEDPLTDEQDSACILRLDHPLQFVSAAGQMKSIREVQIVGYDHPISPGPIKVKGQLDEWYNGHHRREVIIYQDAR